MKLSLVTLALAASFAVACGSSPPPTAQYASTSAAVRAAHEIGADNVPDAQLHVRIAEEQLAQAKRLMNDGDQDKAAWALARAQSDAELAVGIAREAQARSIADQSTAQLHQASERRTP